MVGPDSRGTGGGQSKIISIKTLLVPAVFFGRRDQNYLLLLTEEQKERKKTNSLIQSVSGKMGES